MQELPRTIVKAGYLTSPEKVAPLLEDAEIFPKLLLQRMRERMESVGDHDVLVNAELGINHVEKDSMGTKITRLSDLITHSQDTARILYNHFGVRPGDVVFSSLENSSYFHYPVLGAWLCNATVTITDPGLTLDVLSTQLEETSTRVIFCHRENLGIIQKALDVLGKVEAKIIVMGSGEDNPADEKGQVYHFDTLVKQCHSFEDVPDDVYNTKNDVAIIMWSSGTTGKPKGIKRGFKIFRSYKSSTLSSITKTLVSTCFFHASGFGVTMNCIYNGGTVFFYTQKAMEGNKAGKNLVLAVDKFKPSILIAGTHHIMELAQMQKLPQEVTDLTSLKVDTERAACQHHLNLAVL